MPALRIYAGPVARHHIAEHGLRPTDVGVVPAAAGGPKGLVMGPLDRFLFGEWLPRTDHPVILPRASEGLYLLQRLRDEAHRFAITFHRQRRSKAMTTSQLDGIPGLGESRQKALLRHFGSVKRLRAAEAAEIMAVPGIGKSLASAIVTHLAEGAPPEPAVNLTTGEVLE